MFVKIIKYDIEHFLLFNVLCCSMNYAFLLIGYETSDDFQVTTDDGYILGMQRIPVGRSGKKSDKPPVLLQHGLMVVGDFAISIIC